MIFLNLGCRIYNKVEFSQINYRLILLFINLILWINYFYTEGIITCKLFYLNFFVIFY